MKKFTQLYQEIDQTQSTNEKVAYLNAYFSQALPQDAAWALFFLSGYRLKRFISAQKLFLWAQEITHYPAWLIEEVYASVGDTAEAIALLLPSHESAPESDLHLSEWIENRLLPLYEKSEDEQKSAITEYWRSLNRNEIFILNKLLTGSFRVGVSHLLTLRAISQVLDVPVETLSHKIMGEWKPSKEFYEGLKLEDPGSTLLNPYPFYLASPLEKELESLGEAALWSAEWKWDGIRAQGIHKKGQTALWSRGNELISHQFPEITELLNKLPENTIVDGEILAYDQERPLPFGSLQKRLGRKKVSKAMIQEIPIVFMLYDVLEFNGVDYRTRPFSERRSVIESLSKIDPKVMISPTIPFSDWQTIREQRLIATDLGTEGIMLKKLDTPYGVGRKRGAWYKYKVDPMTIDAVLLYAQAGKGRRANTYTDYTFGVWNGEELIPIAKAYSGLSQEEIDELDKWIKRNTMEKFGPARKVKAHHVFELAFEGIQESKRHKSGVALRFPRISRWRKDKPLEEADQLEAIKQTFLK